MDEQEGPKHLLVDWKIDMLMSLDGATFTFLVLPMKEGPQEAGSMQPLGIGIREMRRLHADLGEMLRLADSRGTPQPGTTKTQ